MSFPEPNDLPQDVPQNHVNHEQAAQKEQILKQILLSTQQPKRDFKINRV